MTMNSLFLLLEFHILVVIAILLSGKLKITLTQYHKLNSYGLIDLTLTDKKITLKPGFATSKYNR